MAHQKCSQLRLILLRPDITRFSDGSQPRIFLLGNLQVDLRQGHVESESLRLLPPTSMSGITSSKQWIRVTFMPSDAVYRTRIVVS